MEEKEHVTLLLKITKVRSTGPLGTLLTKDYTGKQVVVIRSAIKDSDIKELENKWAWVQLLKKGTKHYYIKHVVCPELVYHQLRDTWLAKEREKDAETQRVKALNGASRHLDETPSITPKITAQPQ